MSPKSIIIEYKLFKLVFQQSNHQIIFLQQHSLDKCSTSYFFHRSTFHPHHGLTHHSQACVKTRISTRPRYGEIWKVTNAKSQRICLTKIVILKKFIHQSTQTSYDETHINSIYPQADGIRFGILKLNIPSVGLKTSKNNAICNQVGKWYISLLNISPLSSCLLHFVTNVNHAKNVASHDS